jgi:hypothetical protein
VEQGGPARRRRSRVVSLSVSSVLVATSLAACGSGEPGAGDGQEYRGICVDEDTRQRVDDDECDDSHPRPGLGWVFFAAGSRVAGIGQRVSGGVTRPPARAAVVRGGVPGQGATISRGGLGGSGGDTGVGG